MKYTFMFEDGDGNTVTVTTKKITFEDIVCELKGFFLATGFAEKTIDEYITTE